MNDDISVSASLRDKRALVFGAGGSIGAAVAKEFVAEGAEVFLTGRTKANIETAAKQIAAAGGRADAAVIDATDEVEVDRYVASVADRGGGIDIVFNAIGPRANEYGNGKHAVDLGVTEFMVPLATIVKSQLSRRAQPRVTRLGIGQASSYS
jgi:3-oxoacyl-[acyl-carrier protein] reductase